MNDLLSSRLFDHNTFYQAFEKDLKHSRHCVLIESPFITSKRIEYLFPILHKLRLRNVRVIINTRCPDEHSEELAIQAALAIKALQSIGVAVLYTGKHHRKLAIIDAEILWEGSLNILSQSDSCEIMRRAESQELARQMALFVGLESFSC